MPITDQIIHADLVTKHFGLWPMFHDAEVMSLALLRQRSGLPFAELVMHAWSMTNKVDDRGHYILEKHCVVRFRLEDVESNDFTDFNHQNVLFELSFERADIADRQAIRVVLNSSFGLSGTIVCNRVVVIDLTPCNEKGGPLTGPLGETGR